MKFKILNILFFLIGFTSFGQGSDPLWDRDFAWGGDTADYLMDVVETDNLTVVSGGHSYSSSKGDQKNNNFGLSDFWVIEEDTIGNILWNSIYGGDSTELFSEIVKLEEGYLLTGSSISGVSGNKTSGNNGGFDYWILKVDQYGSVIWDKSFGGSENDFLTCAELLNNGNIILGGYSNSGVSGNKTEANLGENDYWVLVLDANGNLLWNKTIGGEGDDIMTSIYYEAGIYLGGYSNSGASSTKTQPSFGGYDYWINYLVFEG